MVSACNTTEQSAWLQMPVMAESCTHRLQHSVQLDMRQTCDMCCIRWMQILRQHLHADQQRSAAAVGAWQCCAPVLAYIFNLMLLLYKDMCRHWMT